MYTVKQLRAMLPKVGDTRMEKPTIYKAQTTMSKPTKCVVVEVNRARLWYRVRFPDGGMECYKLPHVTWRPFGGAET